MRCSVADRNVIGGRRPELTTSLRFCFRFRRREENLRKVPIEIVDYANEQLEKLVHN